MDNFLCALIDKVNDALFEILGLMLPSLTLCVVLMEPVLYLKPFWGQSISPNDFLQTLTNINQFGLTIFIIVIFYVVGNVIKVVSKLYYDLGKAIFDNTLFLIIAYIFNVIKRGIQYIHAKWGRKTTSNQNMKEKSVKKFKDFPFVTIVNVIYTWIKKILSFSITNYDIGFENLYIDMAMNKLKIFDKEQDKRDKWYLFYKEATTIIKQNKIDTLYYKHLAKYNSFRSLESVFFCAILYNIFFQYMNINRQIYFIVLGINIVCLISFHEKYKRYWRLCGNEVISGLNYYYKNVKGNTESE